MTSSKHHPILSARQRVPIYDRDRIFDPDLNWSGLGLERIFRNLQENNAVPTGTRFELERYVLTDYLRQAQADRP